MAVAAAESTEHVDSGHGVSYRRSHERFGDRHVRPRILGARRHESAARHRGEGAADRSGAGVFVQTGRCYTLADELELGSTDEPRDAAPAEPALRRAPLRPPN